MTLNTIMRGLQLAQNRLATFQEKNSKAITGMQNELHVKEREQERAKQAQATLADFL